MRARLAVDVDVGWTRRPAPPPAGEPFVVLAPVQATASTTLPFMTWGYNGGVNATVGEAEARVPGACTLFTWSVRLTSALAAGESITFAVMVNGVADATMAITLMEGQIDGEGNGTIVLVADDRVAVRATFTGLTSKAVRGFVFGLSGAAGSAFFVTAVATISGFTITNAVYGGVDGSGVGDYTAFDTSGNQPNAVIHSLLAAVTLTRLTAWLRAVATGTHNFDPSVAGGASFGTVTVGIGQQGGSSAVSGAWPTVAAAANVNAGAAHVNSNGAETVLVQLAIQYAPASPYAGYSIIGSPLSAGRNFGSTAGNADRIGLPMSDVEAVDTGGSLQLRWPNVPGTFQYFIGMSRHSTFGFGAISADYRLDVNGIAAITASVASVSTNPAFVRNDVSMKHVVSGDLVEFAAQHDGPYGGNARWGAVIGFLPD